ncbi:unnamed protein product, partial [Allacma fusca]
NGTNFRGASRELKEAMDGLDHTRIQAELTNIGTGIRWHFNPPASPHIGGSWEGWYDQ